MKKKQVVRLNESQLHKVIRKSVKKVLSELDWKTYANAAKKRLQQYRDTNDTEKWNKYWDLQKAANKSFDDKYVGLMKYDTLGDKLKGKHSPKFDANISLSSKNMPYSAVNGYNKNGDKLFSTEKGTYHSSKGITTPNKFFKDTEVGDAYTKANDELWDYHNGNYAYDNENGWLLKEQLKRVVAESMKKVLKENYDTYKESVAGAISNICADYFGWSWEDDYMVDEDGNRVEWTDSDYITFPPIEDNGNTYVQVNFWGDGTLEIQDTEGESVNYNEFDTDFLKKVLASLRNAQLNESVGYSSIDNELNVVGAKISKVYSEPDFPCVIVDRKEDRKKVVDIMGKNGYKLYDSGSEGKNILLTFKKK